MSVTVNKPLSHAKELFLSIALVAQEISSDTVKEMKKDFGESVVRNSVIRILTNKGYIQKVGDRSDYGYVLTGDGYDYVRIKMPDKFPYHIFRVPTHIYDRVRRVKRRQMSLVLYYLYREGVAFGNHLTELDAMINGEPTELKEPFFVTQREISQSSTQLNTAYGTRFFGVIVTQTKIIIVYSPSKNKNLFARTESGFYQSITCAFSAAAAPYHLPSNIEYIYFYQTDEDVIDSFSETGKRNVHSASTYRMYCKSILKQLYIYRMNVSSFRLSDIFDMDKRNAIDAVFTEYYEVQPRALQDKYDKHICGYYRNTDIPVFMLWDLSPSALVSAIDYTHRTGFGIDGKVYLMCFEEDSGLIADILNTDRHLAKHFAICDLPYHEVKQYINGEIACIE